MTSYGFSTFETFRNDNDNKNDDENDTTLETPQIANSFISLDKPFLSMVLGYQKSQPTPIPILTQKENMLPNPKTNANTFPLHESIRQKLDTFYETQKIPHIIFH